MGRAARPAPDPSALRHTHATLALRAGIHPRVVQERLGHANVSVTLDTYSHVDMDIRLSLRLGYAPLSRAMRSDSTGFCDHFCDHRVHLRVLTVFLQVCDLREHFGIGGGGGI